GGGHLLDEILQRIDRSGRGQPLGSGPSDILKRLNRSLPAPWRRPMAQLAAPAIRRLAARRSPASCREHIEAAERIDQRFFSEPNNSVIGGVRLNLAGRPPNGRGPE